MDKSAARLILQTEFLLHSALVHSPRFIWAIHVLLCALKTAKAFTAKDNWDSALFIKLARLHSLDVFPLLLHCCLAAARIALVFKAEP